jgi:hypothetical protein
MANCIICQEPKDKHSKFLICSKCADPEKIILYCTKCRQKTVMKESYLDHLRNDLGMEIPQNKGVVIKIDACFKCTKNISRPQIEVYGIRTGLVH